MKLLLAVVVPVLCLVLPALSFTQTHSLTYDTRYDDGHTSLNKVTCAHGEHGLLTQGYSDFKDVPTYPAIAAAPQISTSGSSYCGSCWELTYTDPHGVSTSLNVTAIDATGHSYFSEGFITSLKSLDHLTHGQGKKLKSIPVTVIRKSPKACGL